MNRKSRAAYAAAGIASAAALLLTAPGQASAVTYTYSITNPVSYMVDYVVSTYDENGVLQSEESFRLGPGERKNWLTTNDGGHIFKYKVDWTAHVDGEACKTTNPLTYNRTIESIEQPNATALYNEGCQIIT